MTDNTRWGRGQRLGGGLTKEQYQISYVRYQNLKPFPDSKFKIYHGTKLFEDLKESIKEIGLQQLNIVRRITGEEKMMILSGHHRARRESIAERYCSGGTLSFAYQYIYLYKAQPACRPYHGDG